MACDVSPVAMFYFEYHFFLNEVRSIRESFVRN